MSPEEIIRLECLKLAICSEELDHTSAITRAQAYSNFVLANNVVGAAPMGGADE